MKEFYESLKDLYANGHYVKDTFEKLCDLIEKYERETNDTSYRCYIQDIITEDYALDHIQDLCSLEEIYDFINGQYGADLYQEVYGRLEEYDMCCLNNTIEEIIDDLEERIEQEKNNRIINEIRDFDNSIIIGNTQCNVLTDDYAIKLGNRLCEKFDFEEKKNGNNC